MKDIKQNAFVRKKVNRVITRPFVVYSRIVWRLTATESTDIMQNVRAFPNIWRKYKTNPPNLATTTEKSITNINNYGE